MYILLDARKLYVLIAILGGSYLVTMALGLFRVFQTVLFMVGLLSGIAIMYYHGYEQGFEEGFSQCLRGSRKTESSN